MPVLRQLECSNRGLLSLNISPESQGQKFTGDLLLDGKIKSQETDKIYASPTAWAVSCKKIINPAKQSGCGWATVRYKGRKLDAYKNIWIKKQYEEGSLAYDFMEGR